MRALTRVLRGAGTIAAGALAWGVLVERHLYTIRRESLPLGSPDSTPIRMLHLSDLHLTPWQRRKVEWVRSLAELNPDVLVLTGDLLGHRDSIGTLHDALEPFAARGVPGVFVHGSNDYYGPILKNPLKYLRAPNRRSTRIPDLDTPRLTRVLTEDLGFTDVNNTAQRVNIHGQSAMFFGMNDPHVRYDDPAAMLARVRELDSDAHADALRFGVVHAPYQESLDALVQARADLILAGHTHGGQVRVPGIGSLTSNCDLPNDQGRGLSVWFDDEHASFLNVSAGLGTSIYAPVRIACRPEASLMTITASNALLAQ